MFSSKLQIILEKDKLVPGEPIKGDILIDTPHAFKIKDIILYFKGRLRFRVDFVKNYQWDSWDEMYLSSGGIDGAPNVGFHGTNFVPSSVSYDKYHMNLHRSVKKSYKTPIIDFKYKFDFSEFVNARGYIKQGLTVMPFTLNPEQTDGLIPSCSLETNCSLQVDYYVQAMVYYPSSYFTFGTDLINLRWSNYTPVKIFHDKGPKSSPDTILVNTSYKVGYWDYSSLKPMEMLKFTFGFDTATDAYDMNMKLTLPKEIVYADGDYPVYISDFVTLDTSYVAKDKLQLVPQMEVTQMVVEIQTVATYRYYGFEWNDDSDNACLLKVSRVGEIPSTHVAFDPVRGFDLCSLLCGFKLPSDLPDSILTPNLQVYHFLTFKFKIKVKPEETDGTNQSSTKIKIGALLNLRRIIGEHRENELYLNEKVNRP